MKADLYRTSLLTRALSCLQSQSWMEAKMIVNELLASNKRDAEALALQCQIAASFDGDHDFAIACARKCVELQPRNWRFQRMLGDLLSRRGKYEEASGCFRKA